jgi:hypothetical protein
VLELGPDVAAGRDRGLVHLLAVELRRREVAEMLVEPVGHEGSRDPGVPPRVRTDLLQPLPRDVPVVDDVVVVEDHEARHGREEPADVGVAPRLAVEPGVLLEAGDLLARRLGGVAMGADEVERLGRDLVGVHLVAAQEQAVRPRLDPLLQAARVRPQRVDAEAVLLVGRKRVRLALRCAHPA